MFSKKKILPKPIGDFIVGITKIDVIDKDRKQVFDFEDEEANRKIPVYIYYPSDDAEENEPLPYVSKDIGKIVYRNYFGLVPRSISKINTHIYKNIKISNRFEKYKVVFINHGYKSLMEVNTILISNLVSMGFIVVSVGHPYEVSVVEYTDGSQIKYNKAFNNLFYVSKEKRGKLENIFQVPFDCSDESAMEATESLLNLYSNEVNEHVDIWVEDCRVVLNELESMNSGVIDSIFNNSFDLENGVAIIGHSYGGTTSAKACLVDNRFTCGVNIDGGTFGNYLYKDIKKPFMFIGSPSTGRFARTTYLYNTSDSYMVLVNNTAHMGYTDALFIARRMNLLNKLGKRDKYEFNELVTKYIHEFLKKYLSLDNNVDLRDLSYNDVDFLSNQNL